MNISAEAIASNLSALPQWWESPYRGLLLPTTPAGADLSHWPELERPNAGKSPGVIGPDGRWQPLDLRRFRPSFEGLAAVLRVGGSLALRTGLRLPELGGCGLFVLDIDVNDAEVADAMRQLAVEQLGPAPCRIGQAPRSALIYRARWRMPTRNWHVGYAAHNGPARAQVDALSTDLRFVCQGIHKTTKQPYRWVDRPLWQVPPAELPQITQPQFYALMAAFGSYLGERQGAISTPTHLSFAIHKMKQRLVPRLPPLGLLKRLPQGWFYHHWGAEPAKRSEGAE